MNNNLLPLHISDYSAQEINELKYTNSKKNDLKVAKEVESIFIQILLKNMRNTLSHDNIIDSNQSHFYTDIYDQKISQEITSKGIGLTKIILQNINKQKKE